jgi:hypothetical protein
MSTDDGPIVPPALPQLLDADWFLSYLAEQGSERGRALLVAGRDMLANRARYLRIALAGPPHIAAAQPAEVAELAAIERALTDLGG